MSKKDSYVQGESKARTLLEFLKEEEEEDMDGVNQRSSGSWKNLKNRFGFKGLRCCGAIWSTSTNQAPNLMNVREEDEENDEEMNVSQIPVSDENSILIPNQSFCVSQNPAEFTGLNLAAALAAERNLRGIDGDDRRGGPTTSIPSPPLRVSLMRLLREGDSEDAERARDRLAGGGGCNNDTACCVCMERSKGAAFIPCGHTFCRVCCRDIWLNRGSCAICNRSIVEVLDIF
ncbi:hypothetical protein C5167_019045 [Papaver somniferum]|uniref:RING-type domain-containing protein n=1 Tax=Papaver somniferum TaxID=3469 RepID=A0A4Y7IP16_PAPSO|nr:hypothetical protein C5167_019045 [Papaver somniferum]